MGDRETTVQEIRARFSRVRLMRSTVLLFLILFLSLISFLITTEFISISLAWQELSVMYLFYFVLGLAVLRVFFSDRLQIGPIFSEQRGDRTLIIMVIPMMIFSLGLAWMTIITLHIFSAGAAEAFLGYLDSPELLNQGTENTLFYFLATFGVIALLGPIVEEFIFRGILIERLGSKYGYKIALIVSSLIFGVLHANLIGATLVGLALGVIYLKTGSLLIPVIIHCLNNGITTILMFSDAGAGEEFASAAYYVDDAWFGSMFFLAGLAWFVWFLKTYWGEAISRVPFNQKTPTVSTTHQPATG